MNRLRLGVNIDHVATLRNARGSPYPDPLRAAEAALAAGADIITAHLREDRRHIRDEDIAALTEPACSAQSRDGRDRRDARDRACAQSRTPAVSFPSGARKCTTEHGLDAAGLHNRLAPYVRRLGAAPFAFRSSSMPTPRRSTPRARSAPPTSSCTPAPMPRRCSRATRTRSPDRLKRYARAPAGRPRWPRGSRRPWPDLRQCRSRRRHPGSGRITNRTLSRGRSGLQRP